MTRWSGPVEVRLHQETEDDPVVLEQRAATVSALERKRGLSPSVLADVLAFAAMVFGFYELLGLGAAAIVLSVLLLIVGVALDGLSPIKLSFAVAHDIGVVIRRKRFERRRRREREEARSST
jgi:hypothetical protein